MRGGASLAARLYMTVCLVVLLLPVVVVAGSALNGGRTMFFPPKEPTLARFVDFFVTEEVWLASLRTSVVVAISSAALATLLAWPIAYRLWRNGGRGARLVAGAAALPFVLPPIVFGVGLGFLWGFAGVLGQLWAGIVSHALLHLALPLVTISIGLGSIDRNHLDAAATMGATESVTFRTVVLPQTLAWSLSGFLFAMVLSFNEFIVMFFVSSSSFSTVTLQIFNSLRNGFTPTMAVGAITFMLASVAIYGLVGRFGDLPRLLGADPARDPGLMPAYRKTCMPCPNNPCSSAARCCWSSTSRRVRSWTAGTAAYRTCRTTAAACTAPAR